PYPPPPAPATTRHSSKRQSHSTHHAQPARPQTTTHKGLRQSRSQQSLQLSALLPPHHPSQQRSRSRPPSAAPTPTAKSLRSGSQAVQHISGGSKKGSLKPSFKESM